MARLGTSDRPLRVAVVGAGPAGLHAAQALLDQPDLVLTIDVLNRFPTPFGLVRDGVAPDHPSIKAVTRVLDQTLADPRVRFFGNVTFGVDLHHHDLKRFYDQIVFAVGAQADRRMSIPGEDLPNSLAALAFVGWYDGHPDYRDLEVDLGCERADRGRPGGQGQPAPPPGLRRPPRADGAAPHHPALPGLAGRGAGLGRAGRGGADRAQRPGRRPQRRPPLQGHRPVRGDRGRPGAALHRLPQGADRGGAVRPRHLDREQHRRPDHPPQQRRGDAGGVRGRLGQARPHRQQQARLGLTVAAMVADLPTLKGIRDDHRDPAKVEALLRRRGIDYASYADWRVLDAHEIALGASQGRPRVKVCAVPEMMEIIRRGR